MLAAIARLVEMSRVQAAVFTAIVLALAVAGAMFVMSRISIDTDVGKLINPNLPWRLQQEKLDKAFPQNVDVLAVLVEAPTPDETEDATTALAARLARETDLFKRVRRPDGGNFFNQNGLLFLSTQNVQDFADQIISAQPLIGTLAADPSLRGVFDALDLAAQGAAQGGIDTKGVDTAFTAVDQATKAALAGQRRRLSWQNLLTGEKPDQNELRRFILTQPVLDYSALEPAKRATDAIHAAARELGLTPANGARVRVTGSPALSDAEFSTLRQGAERSTALSIGLLCLWLLLALRSLRLFLAIVTTLIVGLIACGVFAVGVIGPLNPISAAFAVLFVGLAVDFGIQFSVRYRDERYRVDDLGQALRRTVEGIGGPLVIAGAATAVGFFAYAPTDYTGVRDLGLIAGVGMIIALVLNMTLLPALLTLLRPPGERRSVGFARAAALDHALVQHRGRVMIAAAVLGLAAIATLPWLRFDFNPLHLQNPNEEAVSTLFDLMKDPNTTPYTIDLLEPSLAHATQLADRLAKLPEVSQAVTAASYVPEDQDEKLAILQDAAMLLGPTLSPATVKPAPDDDAILAAIRHCAADVKKAAAKGSQTAAQLAQTLDAVLARGAAAVPLLKTDLAAGVGQRINDLRLALQAQPVTLDTLPAALKGEWVAPDGQARIEVFPKGDTGDNEVLRRFARAVQKIAPDATGTPITIQESARTVTHAFFLAGIIAIAAIALLLAVVLRRAHDVALVLAPLLLAGLLTLATSVLVGLPLNFANIIALPLLLGIGVAFDIYFVMRWRAGFGDLLQSSTARAILFSALTTGTAFGSLALSNHPGTSEMGKLLTLALFYTLLCTFFVLPALLGPVRR
ncbi:MAG TPA: MMPL family transporter [Stellaceae bacterium]|nr:MMPL family transporter [Stellaceae bacterium]